MNERRTDSNNSPIHLADALKAFYKFNITLTDEALLPLTIKV